MAARFGPLNDEHVTAGIRRGSSLFQRTHLPKGQRPVAVGDLHQ